jgi:hypothetical protein
VVDGLVVEVLGGDGLLDDLLLDLLAELLNGDVGRVLGGDNDGVNTERNDGTVVVCVLDGDLGLGVGPEPRKGAVVAGIGHGLVKLVGKLDGERQVLGGLVGGVSEHDTLVTGTKLLESLLIVKTLSNIGALLLNGNEDVASLVVEALLGRVVANVLDGVTDDLLVVDLGLGGDLAEDHDHAGLGGSLASDLGERVLLEAGIEDGVGDLVSDLVGVTLANGLGGETAGSRVSRRVHIHIHVQPGEKGRSDEGVMAGWDVQESVALAGGAVLVDHGCGCVVVCVRGVEGVRMGGGEERGEEEEGSRESLRVVRVYLDVWRQSPLLRQPVPH